MKTNWAEEYSLHDILVKNYYSYFKKNPLKFYKMNILIAFYYYKRKLFKL